MALDQYNQKLSARAKKTMFRVKDRRRARVGKPVDGRVGNPLPKSTSRTKFLKSVYPVEPGTDVLMNGINIGKIGGDILKGRLKGYQMYSLALEERKTCPRNCLHWRTCYGNSSPHTKRWEHGPALEREIQRQVPELLTERPLMVRLHQLGDFYSWHYLCLWAALLDDYDHLAVFGFTAHLPGTQIGDEIARLREAYPHRFAVRTSGTLGPWGSATLDYPTEKRRIGDAIVCPEQLDANAGSKNGTHCGSCTKCWETDRAILFIEHGRRHNMENA